MRICQTGNFLLDLAMGLFFGLSLVYLFIGNEVGARIPVRYAEPHNQPNTTVFEQETANRLWHKHKEKMDSSVHYLALAMYFEARDQSDLGAHVAHIVINRMLDKRWPSTVEKVVRQNEKKRDRCQFSFMCDGKVEKPTEQEVWVRIERIAFSIWLDHTLGRRSDPTGGAHSYVARRLTVADNWQTSVHFTKYFNKFQPVDIRLGHILFRDKKG